MNGKHEVRLERIERSLRVLHEKMDEVVEQGAVNRTHIVWLRWCLRLVFGALLGVGSVTASQVL